MDPRSRGLTSDNGQASVSRKRTNERTVYGISLKGEENQGQTLTFQLECWVGEGVTDPEDRVSRVTAVHELCWYVGLLLC